MSSQTIHNRFDALAATTDVSEEINAQTPIPQRGRRFWYDVYSSLLEVITEGLKAVAAEQGSASPEVVLQNYRSLLSDAQAQQLRREYMYEQFAAAFAPRTEGEQSFTCPGRDELYQVHAIRPVRGSIISPAVGLIGSTPLISVKLFSVFGFRFCSRVLTNAAHIVYVYIPT